MRILRIAPETMSCPQLYKATISNERVKGSKREGLTRVAGEHQLDYHVIFLRVFLHAVQLVLGERPEALAQHDSPNRSKEFCLPHTGTRTHTCCHCQRPEYRQAALEETAGSEGPLPLNYNYFTLHSTITHASSSLLVGNRAYRHASKFIDNLVHVT